ncbi:MAG: alpha/beta hydrolase [Oscillospiraceae bacterium]|nr:alpha/beta hydrolase [Oscillospiraceae bacterium]
MIKVTKVEIPGLPASRERRMYVYTPKDYEKSDRRYPVLYMFDGHNVFYDSHATYGKSWGMKEYLEKTKMPIILAAIECNPDGLVRLSEYSPWDFKIPRRGEVKGLGKITMDWITGVMKPEVDNNYRTLPDRENTLIAGSSMGGLMSIYAAVEYNSVFSRAAALSSSFWVSKRGMSDLIRSAEIAEPTKIYMDMGGGEASKKSPAGRLRLSETMFNTAKLLTEKGADVAARIVPGAVHNEAAWEKRIPVFMDYLFGKNE